MLRIIIVSDAEFTRMHQKFKLIIIYCFCKMSRSATKFGYIFKVGRVTLCTKNNNCTMYTFCKNESKVQIHYRLLLCKIFHSTMKFGWVAMVRKTTIHIKYSQYKFSISLKPIKSVLNQESSKWRILGSRLSPPCVNQALKYKFS